MAEQQSNTASDSSRLIVDDAFEVAPVNDRLFGSFVEHLGRCVYDGIYEPSHPEADEDGFRKDVIELVRELGATFHTLSRRQFCVRLSLGRWCRPEGKPSASS